MLNQTNDEISKNNKQSGVEFNGIYAPGLLDHIKNQKVSESNCTFKGCYECGFVEDDYFDKDTVKELLEKYLSDYQEEATTKWSSVPERTKASNQYEAIEKLKKELFGDE